MRENHLKLLDDGIVLRSQACLIGDTRLLRQHKRTLDIASIMLELIEARAQAHNRSMLTAYLHAENPEAISAISTSLSHNLSTLGHNFEFRIATSNGNGKTIATSIPDATSSYEYSISGVVNVKNSATELLEIVAILRNAGATHINITPLSYRFQKSLLACVPCTID